MEENLQKLINIFGICVVYCLIEGARLITAEKNSQDDHWKSSYFGNEINFDKEDKFRERKLVNLWIMHIFNPTNMLNLFLTTISNSSNGGKNNMDETETVSKYNKYLKDNQMNRFKQNTFRPTSEVANRNAGDIDFHPTTLDLFFKQIKLSMYGDQIEPKLTEYWKLKPDLYPHLIRSSYDQSILHDLSEDSQVERSFLFWMNLQCN